MQMVTVTQIQRNLKHILDNLVPKNPTLIIRDSIPEAVILSFEEYKRLSNLERETIKDRMLALLDDLAEKNKNISFEELDRDIEYAKKHTPRSN